MAIITPWEISMNTFSSGKNTSITYEFYNPSAVSRQLAFGQLPIKLYFADVIKPKETITNRSDWDKVVHLPLMSTLQTLIYPPRWQELKGQLFAASSHTYRHQIDPEHIILDDAVSFF